jgi:hypothetical protein
MASAYLTRLKPNQPESYADDSGWLSYARAGLSDCFAWVHSNIMPDLTRPYEFLPRTNLDGGGMRGRPAGSPLHGRPSVWM